MTFQILTAMSVKIEAFWDTAPWSLLEFDRRLRGAFRLSKHLRNVGQLLCDYKA